MKTKTIRMIAALACGLATVWMASCSDEKEPETFEVGAAIAAPAQVTLTKSTITTLSFEWSGVNGAVQYGYELKDVGGKAVAGGTTKDLSVVISGLDVFTSYTFDVKAIPAVGKGSPSAAASAQARTLFYEPLDNTGLYYSNLRMAGVYWNADIVEDRSAEDYEEGSLGIFTIKNFYNKNNYNLVFRVNYDKTITILNSSGYADEEGRWATVATGWNSKAYEYLKNILIDESSSFFDYDNSTLTFTAKTTGTGDKLREDVDTFKW